MSASLLDPLNGETVNTGCAFVSTHPLPGRLQRVAPEDPVIQHVKPELRFLLGLLAQLLSQKKELLRQPTSPLRFRCGFLRLRLLRSGTLVQAVLPSSYSCAFPSRPLGSTIVTRFPATMGLSDSRPGPSLRLCLPTGRWVSFDPHPARSPRFLDRSFHARCPLPPREVRRLRFPVASSSMSGFITLGRLATSTLRHEAEPGSLALRLTCLPCKAPAVRLQRPLARLPAERVISRVNSFQFTRSARLILALPKAQRTPRLPRIMRISLIFATFAILAFQAFTVPRPSTPLSRLYLPQYRTSPFHGNYMLDRLQEDHALSLVRIQRWAREERITR
jgi:hypothetical protein